jgi:hypothetical protein
MIVILLTVLLFSAIAIAGFGKGSEQQKAESERLLQIEKERLNAPRIKDDGSKIPVKVYDEKGNLLLETNSQYYIEHQDEIFENYKSGKYSQ